MCTYTHSLSPLLSSADFAVHACCQSQEDLTLAAHTHSLTHTHTHVCKHTHTHTHTQTLIHTDMFVKVWKSSEDFTEHGRAAKLTPENKDRPGT